MSVDSTTLERSALERKDREELTTIATALGAKPPSRARKAEIVQLILELTGVADAEKSGKDAGKDDAGKDDAGRDAGAGAASQAPRAGKGRRSGGGGEEPTVDPTDGKDGPE